ncbi:Plasmodium vivax Vir protein, putative [Plasmodium vivax]|uniref:Vir protein, putative n=1 Tax=Plasmodium vivax TaxID=5855 RepID=A0A1G4HDK8_PLAVI|nr:Plasmodium vivax Vir protein, putative [Plasmodium vivax]
MVDKIKDIEEWKTKYPFLKDLWAAYENFDETVPQGANKNKYESLCGMFLKPLPDYKTEQYTFCLKLLRNLGHYSDNPLSHRFTPEKCNNLNYWVYNSMKKHGIPEQIIIDIFGDYTKILNNPNTILGCPYHSYDNTYDDPMVAIMLNIFVSNISDINKTLLNTAVSTYMPSLNFVCECFKIYKDRHNTQCLIEHSEDGKKEKTCDKLKTFKRTYEGYLLNDERLVGKIPSFNDMESEYKAKCHLYEPQKLVVPDGVEDKAEMLQIPYIGARGIGSTPLTTGEDDNADRNLLTQKGEETTGNPLSSTISTAVGTMAGASSVLALLYKFTPGRKWIHSGFGGRRARIGSNFYEEGASELLYNGIENEDFISYNQRYDIGYSPL